MIQQSKQIAETRDSSKPKSVIDSSIITMDIKTPKYFHAPVFQSNRESRLAGNSSNIFADKFLDHTDPLCKLNLRETSDFVEAFPMAKNSKEISRVFLENPTTQKRREGTGTAAQRRLEAPVTPGRPVFNFNGVISESMRSPVCNFSRKSFPSKWDDAEKWLINSSSQESPTHVIKSLEPSKFSKQSQVSHQKIKVLAEKVSASNGFSSDVLLKDKFTDNVVEKTLPDFRYSELLKEGCLFKSSCFESMKDACTEVVAEIPVQHRDVGTEMTPLGSSTTSRRHTPVKNPSPARHNTPSTRSGPLVNSNFSIDISELQDCHFAKLDLGTQFQAFDKSGSCWSSREEEEEEISKSLRHFEMDTYRKSVGESKAYVWEDEERTKCCIRYQREEAKIQAWVNLQSAKVEAQSRKLEMKIQKMRSNLEDKLMKRMAVVHRKAEEWRASTQLQHTQQMLKASEQSQKLKDQCSYISDKSSCGCFP